MTFGKQERTCLLKPATNQPLLLNNAVFYTHFSGYACPHKSAHTLIPPVSLNPVNSNNIVSRRSIMITGPAGACANQLLIQTRAQVVLLTPELMMRIAPAGNQPCKHQAVEQQRIKGSAPAGRGGGGRSISASLIHFSECKTGDGCSGFTRANAGGFKGGGLMRGGGLVLTAEEADYKISKKIKRKYYGPCFIMGCV